MRDLYNPDDFSKILYEKMKPVNPGIEKLELYEFRYGLNNLVPEEGGWGSIHPDTTGEIEGRISVGSFFSSIQLKPKVGDRIVLDEKIAHLTRMLFVGLVLGEYPLEWIRKTFYFDIRGFYFLIRTQYFPEDVLAHFGGKPYQRFEPKQACFEDRQSIGYQEFKEANAEVDQLFINSVQKLIAARGTPIILAIAGPTAAGKTEIVERLRWAMEVKGQKVTSIEMDNFLTDRDHREEKGIHTLGKEALHFELLKQGLEELARGMQIQIPRYDFVFATSSHDLKGILKPGGRPIVVDPADVIFIEGNFPFLLEGVAERIGIKVVYLTDDPIRLKRKWKRDIDYRKKYEPTYFRNRFFKDQFIMAENSYRPQMKLCDLTVDTTGAALWTTPEVAAILDRK